MHWNFFLHAGMNYLGATLTCMDVFELFRKLQNSLANYFAFCFIFLKLLDINFFFNPYLHWFRYDLVDLTRQALAKHANQLFVRVIESYLANDTNGVTFHSQKFLDLVQDMDTLLACHDGFLLGTWLESAKQLAKDEKEEKQV